MNKNFKCVIFDLDGTLINSGPDLLNSLNYVLSQNNLNRIDKNVIGNLVGGGAEAMIRKGYTHLNAILDEKKNTLVSKSFHRSLLQKLYQRNNTI